VSDEDNDERAASEAAEGGAAPDNGAAEPAGPAEVVSPGGAAPARTRRPGSIVRIGLIALLLIGGYSIVIGALYLANPEDLACDNAISIIEDETDEDVDDDLPCDQAFERADEVSDDAVPDADDVRVFAWRILGVGIILLLAGGYALARRTRVARNVAGVAIAVAVLLGTPLAFIGVGLLLFSVYAIFFSADARAIYGQGGTPRLFRTRR
jgi:hypothetical protein